MEPKSIAFYTAVAIGMLAVLGATIFPALVQAVQAATTPLTTDDNKGATKQGTSSNDNNGDNKQGTSSNDNKQGTTNDRSGTRDNSNSPQVNDNARNTANSGNDDAAARGLNLDSSDGMVSCGSVITQDTTLTRDLNCPGNGLVVAASGVTVDLNGYTISSSEAGRTAADRMTNFDGNSGILVSNADHVSIVGLGKIVGFSRGIAFIGSSNGMVEDVAIRDNDAGLYMSGSDRNQISRNSIDDNGVAAVFETSNEGIVAFNQIIQNKDNGLLFQGSDRNVVAGNNIYDNGANGVKFDAQSSGNMVDYNNILGHDDFDINNADGLSPDVNHNVFGEHNNCGTSDPEGLC